MPREGVRPAFDEEERERIRAALKRYAEQYNLGFDAIANRIAETFGYPGGASFGRTLRRFVNERRDTAHETVALYVRFLAMVAPPDPGDVAGAALARFLGGPDASRTEDLAPLAGRYVTLIRRPAASPGKLVTDRLGAIHFGLRAKSGEVPWSVLELAVPEDGAFLRAKETIIDPCRVTQAKLEPDWMKRGAVQTGILAPCGQAEFVMLLRNYVENRLYLLGRESGGPLRGIALQPTSFVLKSLIPPAQPWVSEFEIRLMALPPSESEKPNEELVAVAAVSGT